STVLVSQGCSMGRLCRFLRALRLAALLGLAIGSLGAASQETAPILVETVSGRVFTGQIDIRTSRQVLVLRTGTQNVTIVRPIEWKCVVRIRLDGKSLTPVELLQELEASGWPRSNQDLPESPPSPQKPGRLPGPSDELSEEGPASALDSAQPLPPVSSLHIEASVAKWNSGADNDGVLLRVFPLDAQGNIVPVGGTLEVDLIGQQEATQTRGNPFPQLARWGQPVDAQDVGANGATYRLPFQAWSPDVNLQFGSYGSVHARLSVPGQGVFDDTATMVRVRPYSSTRDRLQQFRGSRFFPQERTTRGTSDSGFSP
ncbi:MAG TPA: hypothetical protein VGX76_05975, partial [Pirellulales bacterium]|nr:hypothetical protein [Pirellulales bacterium]